MSDFEARVDGGPRRTNRKSRPPKGRRTLTKKLAPEKTPSRVNAEIQEQKSTISNSTKTSSKQAGDGHHICAKTSVNPFFNFLRLYRTLPEAQGKSVPQLAIDGARIWRAMKSEEKAPFRSVALKESRRRLNSRQKRSATKKGKGGEQKTSGRKRRERKNPRAE